MYVFANKNEGQGYAVLSGIYLHGDLQVQAGSDQVYMKIGDLHELETGVYDVQVDVGGTTISAVAFIWRLPISPFIYGRGLIVSTDDKDCKLEALDKYLSRTECL